MGLLTSLAIGGALAGGLIGGKKVADKKNKNLLERQFGRDTQAQADAPAVPGVPAPPPTANVETSRAVGLAGQAAKKVRKRASSAGFASLLKGAASGLARASGTQRTAIGA